MVTTEATQATRGTRRTIKQAAYDAFAARLLKMPKATTSYTNLRDVRIPMRDGVHLLADVLLTSGTPKGTLMSRLPYGWPPLGVALLGAVFARQGYNVVLGRCRGTFGSEGELTPFAIEQADGSDTVAWLRQQPWFGGRLGTFGASYAGFTQFGIMAENPPELVTAILTTTCHDFRRGIFRGGAFLLDLWYLWSEKMLRQEDGGVYYMLWQDRRLAKRSAERKRILPLTRGAELVSDAPWYRRWIADRAPESDIWDGYDLSHVLDETSIPVLLQLGWPDVFLDQGIEQVSALQDRGVEVAMTAGPWTHNDYLLRGGSVAVPESLAWFDQHFTADESARRTAPIRAYIRGDEDWVDLPTWPPVTQERIMYPSVDGELGAAPAPGGARATFTFDPANPTPSIGGPLLTEHAGYVDDSALAERDDVLVFTSPPLSSGFRMLGAPEVELVYATDNPYMDFFARISLVDRRGRSTNVTEGFVRVDATDLSGVITLKLDETGQSFAVGERIRLVVAGGCFPRWERNLGTGDDPASSDVLVSSTRTVALDGSRLRLPTIA